MLTSKNLNYSKKVFGLMALVCLSASSYSLTLRDQSVEINDAIIEKNLKNNVGNVDYDEIEIYGNSEVDARKLREVNIIDERNHTRHSIVTGISLMGSTEANEEIAKLNADKLKIKISSKEDSGYLIANGLSLDRGAEMKVNDLELDLKHSLKRGDDDAISSGIDIYTDKNGKPSKFEANNVNIKMTNTKNSEKDRFLGVEVTRTDREEAPNYFKVNGNLDIQITDNSDKQSAEMTGIFLEAIDTEMEINNSNITLEGKGNTYLNGILIEIADEEEMKSSGVLISKGKMKIDTTKAPNASGIVIRGSGGEIRANSENSSAEIKTTGTAISFKGYRSLLEDYRENYEDNDEDDTMDMPIAGNNQKVSLKNAVITSTEKNGYKSLIHVDEDVKNAVLNISGAESKLTPANGSLMYVKNNSDITFNLTDGALAEGVITNWTSGVSRLNVTNNAVWKLSDSYPSSNVTKLVLKDGGTLDATSLTRDGEIASHGIKSYIDETEDTAVVNDNGIIRMDNNNYSDELVFYKNYEGRNGAKLKVNTLWNNDPSTSKSDKLVIDGEAKGETRVIAVGIDGKENIIDGDIQKVQEQIQNSPVVVEVGKAKAGVFRGTAKTRGAAEAQLTSVINREGKREFFWTLNPVSEFGENEEIIYSSVVPAYASIEKINRDLGFTSLATLNERKGDTRLEKNDKEQAWFRIIGKDADYKGKNRFEADTNLYGAQAGYEFNVGFDKNGNKNIYGAYIAHIEADTKFYDRYRAVNGRISGDKYTGKVKTKDLNLGLTKTKYYTNGMYLDLVGQFSFINNKYQIRDTESKKQKGNAIILSAEIGKKYDVAENWYLEPQAQLAYQYLRLKDFNDGLRDVNYKNEGDFRGRLGLRLATKAKRNVTFYTLANMVHDFDDKAEVRIGRDKVNEKYAKTLGEVGLGAEYLFNEATSMFGDFRYERSFKKNPKYDSYRGTLGLKYNW